MNQDHVTVTLPISEHGLGVVLTVLGVVALSILVLFIIRHDKPSHWLPRLQKRMGLGALPEVLVLLLCIVWTALFLCLLFGIFWVIYGILERAGAATEEAGRELRWYLLTLTAVTASLGALISLPFTLIRVGLNRRQTETAEQGQITDRINKAVEGLGAEKTISRIGRVVRLRHPEIHEKLVPYGKQLKDVIDDPLGFNVLESEDVFLENDNDETFEGMHYEFIRWTKEDTNIEWQGDPPLELGDAKLVEMGDWQALNETIPNLEVRIGAIYALERIAQDSDRDHVQIMEILCAYIRNNSPVEGATPLEIEDPSSAVHFARLPGATDPRADIQVALQVIARRNAKQRKIESDRGFRIGLQKVNLQNSRMIEGSWDGADFEGSNLDQADFSASSCINALFEGCSLANVKFERADLADATFKGSQLKHLQITHGFNNIELLSANLMGATIENCRIVDLSIGNELFCTKLNNTEFQRCYFKHSWFFGPKQAIKPENTRFHRCALQGVEIEHTQEYEFDLNAFFGDGSVSVEDCDARPEHWPKQALREDAFKREWRKWLKDPGAYRPPSAPETIEQA